MSDGRCLSFIEGISESIVNRGEVIKVYSMYVMCCSREHVFSGRKANAECRKPSSCRRFSGLITWNALWKSNLGSEQYQAI